MPVQNRALCKLSILLEVYIKSWFLHSAKFWPLRLKFRKLHFTGFIFSWDFTIITDTCVDKFVINFIGWQEQQLGKIDNLICGNYFQNAKFRGTFKQNLMWTCLFYILKAKSNFLLQKNLKNIMHGHVKMYVMRWPFCWTTFLFDLAPSSIDK